MDRDKTGQPIRIPIRTVDHLANGRGTHGGRTYHIPFVLPGEIVEAETVYHRGQNYYAYPEYLDKPNPKRINADCKHFGRCAGCSYRHLTYEDSFAEKWELTKKLLQPLGELYLKPHPTTHHRYYRTLARFHVHNGQITQHTLLDHVPFVMDVCRLVNRDALAFAKTLVHLPIEQIEIWSTDTGEHMVGLHTKETTLPKIPGEHSVYIVQDGVYTHHQGPKTLSYTLRVRGVPFTFAITPEHFVQSNPRVTEALASTVISHIPAEAKTMLEFYGGMGTLTIPVAHFRPELQITSVEMNASMTDALQAHAQESGYKKIHAVTADVRETVKQSTTDVLLLDPPRKGLHDAVHDYISTKLPKHIIYVSCNPETFLVDAKKLQEQYTCHALHYFDMMPYTRHGEVVGVFSLIA